MLCDVFYNMEEFQGSKGRGLYKLVTMLSTGHMQYFGIDQEKNGTESSQSSLTIIGKILHEVRNYNSSKNTLVTPAKKNVCPICHCTSCLPSFFTTKDKDL